MLGVAKRTRKEYMNTWKVLCEREEMTLANPAIYVWLERGQRERREHPGKPQNPAGSPMGKHQSDRMQVIGEKLLIGQLAPWVTWGI